MTLKEKGFEFENKILPQMKGVIYSDLQMDTPKYLKIGDSKYLHDYPLINEFPGVKTKRFPKNNGIDIYTNSNLRKSNSFNSNLKNWWDISKKWVFK